MLFNYQEHQLIAGADYLLTNGNIFIGSLYNGSKTNKFYYYHKGWNLQALFAYICGIALPFPGKHPFLGVRGFHLIRNHMSIDITNLLSGFCGTLGVNVSTTARHLNELGWLLSFFVALVAYYGICKICPTSNQRLVQELKLSWEQMAHEPQPFGVGSVLSSDASKNELTVGTKDEVAEKPAETINVENTV